MKKIVLSSLAAGVLTAGCATDTGTWGLGGAAAGAAIGAGLNHKNRGKGAAVGALIGGAGGALIGNAKDAKKKRQAQPQP